METAHLRRAREHYTKLKSGIQNNGLYPLLDTLDEMCKEFKAHADECIKGKTDAGIDVWQTLGSPEDLGLSPNADPNEFQIVGGLPDGH